MLFTTTRGNAKPLKLRGGLAPFFYAREVYMEKDFSLDKDEFYPGGVSIFYTYYFTIHGFTFFLNPRLIDRPEDIGKDLPVCVSFDEFSQYLGVDIKKKKNHISGLWEKGMKKESLPKQKIIQWMWDRIYD